MKTILTLMTGSLLLSNIATAQAPGIRWQKCIGGSNFESTIADFTGSPKVFLQSVINHSNYIVGFTSNSTDGDIINNKGLKDVFLGETDSLGNWIWKNNYGGSENEELFTVQAGIDSGYIIMAKTESNDADVSNNHGQSDIWILYLGNTGQIIWQKTFGGTKNEKGGFIQKADDSSYIFIGSTQSTDGDITDNPTSDNDDIWVVKIDKNGNIKWSKTYGGTLSDEGVSVKAVSDGFYIAGNTQSTNGNMTSHHQSTSQLVWDGWIAKLNETGIIQWSRCYGGSKDDFICSFQISNDHLVFAGGTASDDGDIINHFEDKDWDSLDGWVTVLSLDGTMQWSKCLGGTGQDILEAVEILPGNQYLFTGETSSGNGDVGLNHGRYDSWVFRLDSAGTLLWHNEFGGSQNEYSTSVLSISKDKIAVLGSTQSMDFDVIGNHGYFDVWFMELGYTNIIKGGVFLDLNNNGKKDSLENYYNKVKIISTVNLSDSVIILTGNGNFNLYVDTGSISVHAAPYLPYYDVVPASKQFHFDQYKMIDSVDFALQGIPGNKDLSITMFPLSNSIPGSTSVYRIHYQNIGTTSVDTGYIQLIKDSNLTVATSTPIFANLDADTIIWKYSNLNPGDTGSIIVNFNVPLPPVVNIGDTISFFLDMMNDGDLTPENNHDTLTQIIRGSYDPNNKTENHAGYISKSSVSNGGWLTYSIRFQNTGNDTALNIIVKDTLDSKLDWNSFQMVEASNNYQLSLTGGNKCTWHFNNIFLPDSVSNEHKSHGYLVYRVKPKINLTTGNVITNKASIYFDYNLPVQTNTQQTVIVDDLVLPLHLFSFTANHNGRSNLVKWSTGEEINTDHFEIERSNNSRDFRTLGNTKSLNNGKQKNDYSFIDQQPVKATNYYRLKIFDKDGKYTYSNIRSVNNTSSLDVSIYPNPVHQILTLNFNAEKEMRLQVVIIDATGKQLIHKTLDVQEGVMQQNINVAGIGSGNYFIQIISPEIQKGLKFIKR